MTTLNRVLLVEDDPDIQQVARITLEAVGGFEVEVCDDGQQALDKAPVFQPDLILLDVMMPGMDGPTTLGELRSRAETEKTPVVFMTAKVQPQDVQRYLGLGAVDVIAKPFDPMKLCERVQEIWSHAQSDVGTAVGPKPS